jgi:outer membrane receptor protein involved in Fe transport
VVEDTPRFAASTGWTYTTSFGASLSGVVRHIGNRYTDAQNTSAGKLDEYTVMDVHLSSPVAGGVSTFLSVTNAWNERYKHFLTHNEPRRRFYWGVVVRY